MEHILLIEDDRTFSRITSVFLTKQGFQVSAAHTGTESLSILQKHGIQLVLLDYRLPDTNGMDLLKRIKSLEPALPVIIMTSFSDVRTAIRCIKAGAVEYITKPVNPDELLMLIKQSLSTSASASVAATPFHNTAFFKGVSKPSNQMTELVQVVAPTNMTVLIEGESGTGKENIARTIHALSTRSKGPFIALDCGALTYELASSELFGHVKGAFTGALANKTGQFELAHGGTIFLDEVGNLSYEVQVKLLRAIQERIIQPIGSSRDVSIDVRIIAATNENLKSNSRTGNFREDLFHRLNEFKIEVPSLRQRAEDIIGFADFFREQANRELGKSASGFSEEVRVIFKDYPWPGNLRELRNIVRRTVLLTGNGIVEAHALPVELKEFVEEPHSSETTFDTYDLKAIQEKNEREKILSVLQEVRYNKSKAARILNIDRKTLYQKMEKYNIH